MPGSVELFARYRNPVFIETGSWNGDGILRALGAGYDEVYSCEIEAGDYGHCVERFGKNPRVHLENADSGEWIKRILHRLDRPATIFLDAHSVPRGCPLARELLEITNWPQCVETIIIDDMRMLRGGSEWAKGETEIEIVRKVLAIDERRWIGYEADSHDPRDLLVATRRPR